MGQRLGAWKPVREGDGALLNQHRETVGGFSSLLGGEFQQWCLGWLVDCIVNQLPIAEAFVGQDGGVTLFEAHRCGVYDQPTGLAVFLKLPGIER